MIDIRYKKVSGVYMILSFWGKRYIGSTNDLYRRQQEHFCKLKNNKHKNKYLQNSYNKHGEFLFDFIILDICPTREKALEAERSYLKKYRTKLYNLTSNVSIPSENISTIRKEYYIKNPHIKEKLSILASQRTGNRNPFFGKHHSEVTKKKMSQGKLGLYKGTQNKFIKINDVIYFSAGQAAKALNLSMTTVRWRVRSKNPKFKNYQYF